MEKKILVYDDSGTESEEFCTKLAQLSSQTVKVNTRAQTPPLPSFTTSSQPSAPLQTSTPVTTLTTSSSHSQTPGFETLPTVVGLFIGMVFMAGFLWQEKKKGYSYRR
ncbi:MAG: hypothetical protein N2V76_01910 [Methanophagales archaeon]|nr:hypothetical protein [Methanophagales archaeon]